MKRTIIEAEHLGDGRMMIRGIYNASSSDDIIAEFGERALQIYRFCEFHYFGNSNPNSLSLFQRFSAIKCERYCMLEVGLCFTKESFSDVITKLKLAGTYLRRSCKKARKEKSGKNAGGIIRIEI